MTLQAISAGFGRTGTLSLKLALEELGFGPCHHMKEVLENGPVQVRDRRFSLTTTRICPDGHHYARHSFPAGVWFSC